jgi:hypothetical protein
LPAAFRSDAGRYDVFIGYRCLATPSPANTGFDGRPDAAEDASGMVPMPTMFDLTLSFDNGPDPDTTPFVLDTLGIRDTLDGMKDLPALNGPVTFTPTDHTGQDYRSLAMAKLSKGVLVPAD